MTYKRNNLVAKNFGKKKYLKFGLKRFQIVTRCYVNGQMVPEFWSRDGESSRAISHQVIIWTR